MTRLCAVLLLLSLASCSYTPPAQTNTASPSYKADLESCRDAASAAIGKQNAKRALAWIASPVRRWGQISEATGSCMAGKGYGQLRWCRDDELAAARRSGNVVVTATGVQCVEPPTKKPT